MIAVQMVEVPGAVEQKTAEKEFEIKIEIWIDDKSFVADWRRLKPCKEFEKCGHFTIQLHENLDELELIFKDFVEDVMEDIRKIKEEDRRA